MDDEFHYNIFFETHSHIGHIAFLFLDYKSYVSYVTMCFNYFFSNLDFVLSLDLSPFLSVAKEKLHVCRL